MMEVEAHEALAHTLRELLDESAAVHGSANGGAATTRVLLSHQHRNRRPTESVDRWDARDEYLRLFGHATGEQGLALKQLARDPPMATPAKGGYSVRVGSTVEWSPDLSVIEVLRREDDIV